MRLFRWFSFRYALLPVATWVMLIAALAVMTPAAQAIGPGDQVSPSDKAAVTQLARQRDKLIMELRQLDREAARQIEQGKDPVVIHAKQVSAQDKLDLTQLQLEMTAARLGMDVPAEPRFDDDDNVSDDPGAKAADKRARKAFVRGKHRALVIVSDKVKRMLKRVDLSRFMQSDS